MKAKYLILLFFLFPILLFSQDRTVGVFQNDSLSFNGYTLFSPNAAQETYLIDNCGYLINQWSSEFRPGLSSFLMEDGGLLRTARINSSFNGGGSGGRIEYFNWEGSLQWFYEYSSATFHQHHDIRPLPNGNVLILAWELKTEEEAIEAGRDPSLVGDDGIWSEHLVELKPIGAEPAEIVWEWHLWDHLIQDFDSTKNNFGVVADHPELLDINFAPDGDDRDWLHMNAIDYHPDLDQIIMNSRVFNEFYIIDHSTTSTEAATSQGGNSGRGGRLLYRWGNPQSYDRGTVQDQKLFGQHNVHWIPEGRVDAGKIMIYNNGLDRPGGNYSTVEIIDPPLNSAGLYLLEQGQSFGPVDFYWSHREGPTGDFYSSRISGAQRLPNGNTLICVGGEGQFFEITSSGDIVWEYVNPVRNNGPVAQGDNVSGNDVFRTNRYAVDYAAFANKELVPGSLLERNPIADDCQIYGENAPPTSTVLLSEKDEIKIFPNPIDDHFQIVNNTGAAIRIQVSTIDGKIWKNEITNENTFEINAELWPARLYIVAVYTTAGNIIGVQKMIKK